MFQLKVLRSGRTLTVPVASKASGGSPVIGVDVQEQYKFPFTVQISVGDIGGPSAGMMFALGIIDKLTSDNLTGGKFIAGTGEITAAGQVRRSAASSRRWWPRGARGLPSSLPRRATAPTTAGAVPAGLRVVKVSTLAQAVSELEASRQASPSRLVLTDEALRGMFVAFTYGGVGFG